MRVCVIGANGQLGTDVCAVFGERGHDVLPLRHADIEVGDMDSCRAALATRKPDLVVNTAAMHNVPACESDPAGAFRVNGIGARDLAMLSEDLGYALAHVSTDYVFDGTLQRPYREDDTPNPQSVYGSSKLAGEHAAGPDAAIARTSWVCGEHGNNMVKLVLRLAADPDQALAFVDDQVGCPTFTTDLAPALHRLAVDRRTGIHHLTNQGPVSWYEFVREILAEAGHDPDRVRPIATAELDPPRPAPRPANSVLDNAVWRAAGLPMLRDFREPLGELVARLTV